MTLHILPARFTELRRMHRRCPTCARSRRMLGRFQPHYGWLVTCLGCGDSWQDGERMPRPFMRGWREKQIKEARCLFEAIR